MNKIITKIVLLTVLGCSLYACKKDDEPPVQEPPTNTVNIQESLTFGDKTYTNYTFDLGKPDQNFGYFTTFDKSSESNGILIYPKDSIDLGDNLKLGYELQVQSTVVGSCRIYVLIKFYENGEVSAMFWTQMVTGNITKIDEVGGYIEGTYQSMYTGSGFLTGKFKVSRISQPLGSSSQNSEFIKYHAIKHF